MKITSHVDLAKHIEGKKILHLNSLGKDSIATLHWLTNFAKPEKVVSLFFNFLAGHPANDFYVDYLKKRYPTVEFMEFPNAVELSTVLCGILQSPIKMLWFINSPELFEYEQLSAKLCAEDICKEMNFDFICQGHSKYEEYSRRIKFNRMGILEGKYIYPIGMMSKADVFRIIRSSGTKLHPSYKYATSTFDAPSYYKMRAAFIADPNFKRIIYDRFPLMELDEYRWEKML